MKKKREKRLNKEKKNRDVRAQENVAFLRGEGCCVGRRSQIDTISAKERKKEKGESGKSWKREPIIFKKLMAKGEAKW
jgi:hypothetical protein